MTRKKKRETPEWQGEPALIDDYCDYRYRQVFDPLYDKLSRWEVTTQPSCHCERFLRSNLLALNAEIASSAKNASSQ